ncbi:MAG: hypothetical protein Q9199_007995, partial [Rusavskia elegans]
NLRVRNQFHSSLKAWRLHTPHGLEVKALDHHARITTQKMNITTNTNASTTAKTAEQTRRPIVFLVLPAELS